MVTAVGLAKGLTVAWYHYVAAAVINYAISAIIGKILEPSLSKSSRDAKGLQQVFKSNIAPRRVIYGEAIVGGPFIYVESSSKDFDNDNQYLSYVIAIAGHPVEDVLGVFIADKYIKIANPENLVSGDTADIDSNGVVISGVFGTGDAVNHVRILKVLGWGYADNTYVTDETAAKCLQDRTNAGKINSRLWGDWDQPSTTRDLGTGVYVDEGHKLTNCAYVFLEFKYNEDVFNSYPTVRFHVKGKQVYSPAADNSLVAYGADSAGTHDLNDPDTYEWSEDWSTACLDYLLNTSYGLGAKTSGDLIEINWENMVEANLDSSELVTNGLSAPDPVFDVPRYTLNGVFEVNAKPLSNMENLLTSGAGSLIYSQGKYSLKAGVYKAPSSLNDILNEDMLRGPLSIITHTARADLFNKVAGVYVNQGYDRTASITEEPKVNQPEFEPADFPIIDPLDGSGSNPYEVIDGEEIIIDVDFPFCIYDYEAQRIARIQLERIRQGVVIQANWGLEILEYSVGDTIYLEILSDNKYLSEPFFNKLGLDAEVQNRPEAPFTPYYKQFKIAEMTYNQDFTISATLIEESEEIYDWNGGDANRIDYVLGPDQYFDDPYDTVMPPSWIMSTPNIPLEEVANGVSISTLVRWTAPDRGSVINALDKAHIASYRIEYGVVTDPSLASDLRVDTWIAAGTFVVETNSLAIQGPLSIENLFIDNTTDFDFRVKAVTYSGKSSAWVYYSEDIGGDWSPGVPATSVRYYIQPTNGTVIQNGGASPGPNTLTVEAHEITTSGDALLTSGDVKLYVGSVEVTVANGFATPSDGYTGTFDDIDISGSVVVELRDDVLAVVYDTITLADITDGDEGTDATDAYITVRPNYFWYRLTDGTWGPVTTDLWVDVNFVRNGADVARWSHKISRAADGSVSDGGAATHPDTNLSEGDITTTVDVLNIYFVNIKYEYNDGAGHVTQVTEQVGSIFNGLAKYYIQPLNGTAIHNGTGTLTLQLKLAGPDGDIAVTSGDFQLYDESDNVIESVSPGNYPSPSDGYIATLDSSSINGSLNVYIKSPSYPGTIFDTITVVDIDDGLTGVVGWIEPEFLAWRQDTNGGNWVPSGLTTQLDVSFNKEGADVARQGYLITRDSNDGTLTGATTTHTGGDLATTRIAFTPAGSGTTNFTIKADYSFGSDVFSVSETVFTVSGGTDGADNENYYILPTEGTALLNGVGTLTLEAHQVIGGVDSIISTGDRQLYVSGTTLVTVANGFASPSDGYTGTFDSGDISGSLIVQLKDGIAGAVLDSITLIDVIDGTIGVDGVTILLTSYNGVVVSNAWGDEFNMPSNPISYMRVWDGDTEVTDTSAASYEIVAPADKNNLEISVSDTIGTKGEISLTSNTPGWSTETEFFTIRVTYNTVAYDLMYSFSKLLKGRGRIFNSNTEAIVVTADADGTNYTLPNPAAQISFFDSGIDVTDTSAITYTEDSPDTKNGLTIAVSDSIGTKGQVTLTGASWTSASESFDIRVTYDGLDYIKTYSVTKALGGVIGDDGPTGPTGQAVRTVNMYNKNDGNVAQPTQGSFAIPISSANASDGWTLTVPSITADTDQVFVSVRTFTDDAASPEDPTWSTPTVYAERFDGNDGRDGAVVGGIRINTKTFAGADGSSPGDMYVHGMNTLGQPADVSGSFMYHGAVTDLPKGFISTSQAEDYGYIIFDTALGTPFTTGASGDNENYAGAKMRSADTLGTVQWQRDNNSAWTDFTHDTDMIILGTYQASAANNISQAMLSAPMTLSSQHITAGKIEVANLGALSAIIGQLDTRTLGVDTNPRLRLSDTTSPIKIYRPDDDETVIFGVGDDGSGDAVITLRGDFTPGSLDTAQAYSNDGIDNMADRLGLTGGGAGGYITTTTPVGVLTGTTKTLTGSISSAGKDITLAFQFTDNDSGTSGGGPGAFTRALWTVKWQVSINSGGYADVSGASYSLTGVYEEFEHPYKDFLVNWTHSLDASRNFTYTSATDGNTYAFRLSFTKTAGDVFNSQLAAAYANEPGGVDLAPGTKPGMFIGSGSLSLSASTTWKTMDLTTEYYDPDNNYSITSDVITISDPGYYEITYDFNFVSSGGATNDSVGARITKNGTAIELAGSESRTFYYKDNFRPNSICSTFIHLFLANDTIRLQQNHDQASAITGTQVGVNTSLVIKKVRNT